jgi:uncharacterized protein (TIGR02757 family)
MSPQAAPARRGRRLRPRRLSPERAGRLGPLLDRFERQYDRAARLAFDPVELPRRYRDPLDVELVALLSASLAYGRADLFKPQLEGILAALGPRPASFAARLAEVPDAAPFAFFHYRFNRPADVAALVAAAGWVQARHRSLGDRFADLLAEERGLRPALARFSAELRSAPPVAPLLARRGRRGILHLCPDPNLAGACKRWNLYLRWMVRGPDAVDFGLWKRVPRSALMIPLDTHVARIARYLGLTDRTDMTWRTAEEITQNLRLLDGDDPIRFDFALCHLGMSGACPVRRDPARCAVCPLISACRARARSLGNIGRPPPQPPGG